jgi:Aspartyl protease/gag-polyprotein putative aspartyl protease
VSTESRKLISRSLQPYGRRAVAFALLTTTILPAASFAICRRAAADLPITIQDTRPVVGAKLNGQDVKLLVDSGSYLSSITSSAAEQYRLQTATRRSGAAASAAVVQKFTIANVAVNNLEFQITGNHDGDNGNAGLLGQSFLERWDVEYDLANGMVRLMTDDDCHNTFLAYWVTPGQAYTTMSIRSASTKEPLTMGTAYVNGVKIRVTFDTGASQSVLSIKAAERAGVKIDMAGVVDGGATRGAGRSLVKSYIAPFDSFKLENGEEIRHTHLRVADLNMDSDMLLGADFFLSHRVFVANSQNKLYFTYNGGPVFNLMTASEPASQPTAP